jgi:hypothetical protein
MAHDNLKTYCETIQYLDEQRRTKHLLLGNGFSMSYDSKIFSYNALNTFIEKLDNDILHKLFSIINTKNFELVMQQLSNFCEIAEIFGTDKELVSRIKESTSILKNSLIDAVKELHPEHVFTIPESKSKLCSLFINNYLEKEGQIFTTNYDLLLYWVLMRNNSEIAIDGFGREVENPDEYVPQDELEYSELRWGKYKESQTVNYLHGGLPLFDTGIEIIKEEYSSGHYLLDKIKARLENKEYPIFVTAGNGREKLTHIMHNKYLSYCFDRLSSIEGSLVTFGFNFGEYDSHIIDAINIAANHGKPAPNKLFSIYIGIYSDADLKHIESIKHKFKCKVNLYDAKTVNVWG